MTLDGRHPKMSTFPAAPFTATSVHGHSDVIVFLRPGKADELDAVADIVRHQPGIHEVSEVDSHEAYAELQRLARGTNQGRHAR